MMVPEESGEGGRRGPHIEDRSKAEDQPLGGVCQRQRGAEFAGNKEQVDNGHDLVVGHTERPPRHLP